MKTIEIDPGSTGIIAVLDGTGALIEVHDMPTFEFRFKNGQKKNQVDAESLAAILGNAGIYTRPREGSVSAFTFDSGWGMIRGICTALCFQNELVIPQIWQKRFGLDTDTKNATKKKREIANRCGSIYPDAPIWGPQGGAKDGRTSTPTQGTNNATCPVCHQGLWVLYCAHENCTKHNFRSGYTSYRREV